MSVRDTIQILREKFARARAEGTPLEADIVLPGEAHSPVLTMADYEELLAAAEQGCRFYLADGSHVEFEPAVALGRRRAAARALEAAELRRNTLLSDGATDGRGGSFAGEWVAVPKVDFDRLRAAVLEAVVKPAPHGSGAQS